jgi:flagellar basal-body rod protein FlgC
MESIDVSASALAAQRLRMDLIASNLANAETTRTAEGQGPYKRMQAIFETMEDGGVQVKEVMADPRPPQMVFQPGHPDADANGYVAMPNVNAVEEMTDLVSATRSYEANVTALNASKAMTRKALEIGRA